MKEIAFKKMPLFEEVTFFHPDGMYVNDKGDIKQIVVVGPMHFSPQEIADHFNDGISFEVTRMEVLPGITRTGFSISADYAKKLALARGFISIQIERMKEAA